MNLFMLMLGCKPLGRHIEQHDIYFGIAENLKGLVPSIQNYWKEAAGKIHVDAFRPVTQVGDYQIAVSKEKVDNQQLKLYFVNLGGYKPNDLEEYHYKELVVARELEEAKLLAKETVFFKNHLSPHIDDKYGIDVDDIYEIEELLPEEFNKQFYIQIEKRVGDASLADPITNGYYPLEIL
ncbi:DUF1543 domain-containing protein [Sphingobacterium sp. SRCM116780]|uniref:DUF1543 domain-containing protein n=1 Tax=Sphingobacterium sp. SRCM116780 TaxID=2907623 RepID=UPI001F1E30BC|nr:DUF1543 domain-containing protein [Sphingobacterium sp. SRCM116780]UIR57117.1 DUF1543 domain-containing protein [Sphingobacterium sp. SRCM116780]